MYFSECDKKNLSRSTNIDSVFRRVEVTKPSGKAIGFEVKLHIIPEIVAISEEVRIKPLLFNDVFHHCSPIHFGAGGKGRGTSSTLMEESSGIHYLLTAEFRKKETSASEDCSKRRRQSIPPLCRPSTGG